MQWERFFIIRLADKYQTPILGLLTILIVSCSRPPSLNTPEAKKSYAFGQFMALELQKQHPDLDVTVFVRSLEGGLTGQPPELSLKEIQEFQSSMEFPKVKDPATPEPKLSNDQIRLRAEANQNSEIATRFLEENSKAPGVHTTESKLQYKVERQGTGRIPRPEDTVVLSFTGRLHNGSIFEATSPGSPARIRVDQMLQGWREVLALIPAGSKFTAYIPPFLGYGMRPQEKIPVNSLLIFDAELLEIEATKKQDSH